MHDCRECPFVCLSLVSRIVVPLVLQYDHPSFSARLYVGVRSRRHLPPHRTLRFCLTMLPGTFLFEFHSANLEISSTSSSFSIVL